MDESQPVSTEDAEEAIEEVHDEALRSLVADLRENTDASLRMVFRYEGEEYDLVYVRDDVREQFPEPHLQQRVETLMMKGLGDPQSQSALHDFGELSATVRWFENALVAFFPDDEWAGVIVVLDRTESELIDRTLAHLGSD